MRGRRAFGRVLLSAACALALASPARAQPESAEAPVESADEAASPGDDAASPVVSPPRLTSDANVAYPPGAGGGAVVVLELTIDADGTVQAVEVVDGASPFAAAAVAASRQWAFVPAMRDGQAAPARIRFEVRFTEPPVPEVRREAPAPGQEAPVAPGGRAETRRAATEIIVHGDREVPTATLSRAEVRQLPGAFGDPFRAIESLPGVTPIGTGLPYFFVRGAPPGNVGYFLDGVRVPGLFHVAVGPSVIHPALIESVALYPGPYPARYGRFSGGIVAGKTTAPRQEVGGEASLRLVDAGAFVEAPFADGRGHAAAGGRYSYTGAVLSLIVPEIDLAYWDYQLRADYELTGRDRVSVLSFGSYDFLSEADQGDVTTWFDVGFHRVDLRYDRELGDGGHARVATTFGRDQSTIEDGQVTVTGYMGKLRAEVEQPLDERVEVRAGADVQLDDYRTTLDVGPAGGTLDVLRLSEQLTNRLDVTTGAWVEAHLQLLPRVVVVPGLRADLFTSGEQAQPAVDPRLTARFRVHRDVTLVHGFGIVHQRPSFIIPVPGAQPKLDRLQRSVQSSYGVEWDLPSDVSFVATGYHGIHFLLTDPLGISRLDNGEQAVREETRQFGHTYGVELMVRRSLTRELGGYVAYTLARSERASWRVEGPSAFDRRHVLSGALAYELGRRWRAGIRGAFYTGTPADVAYVEAAKSPPRTAPFWRIDWRVEKRWPIGNAGAWWSVVAEVLNTTLNREEITTSCSAYRCRPETFGPVTVPSLGVEASF